MAGLTAVYLLQFKLLYLLFMLGFQTCHPRTAGTECRKAVRECDLPEYCLGDSEYCPDDVFKEDGHECHAGERLKVALQSSF